MVIMSFSPATLSKFTTIDEACSSAIGEIALSPVEVNVANAVVETILASSIKMSC